MKIQCLYGQNGTSPPTPAFSAHHFPIGREKKRGSNKTNIVVMVPSFFSFLIFLFLKEEGGYGGGASYSLPLEQFLGGILVGAVRGESWN